MLALPLVAEIAPVYPMVLRATLLALVLTLAPLPDTFETVVVPEVVDATVPVALDGPVVAPAGGPDRLHTRRSPVVHAPMPFSMLGFELPDGVEEVRVRVAGDDGGWSEWLDFERVLDDEEGPDDDSEEAVGDRSASVTDAAFVGEATRFQLEVDADAPPGAQVAATVLDAHGLSGGPEERRRVRSRGAVAEAASAPSIVSRSKWGASSPRGSIGVASKVDMAVVHHTAGSNSYSRSQAPGIVRGIQHYHMNSLGWSDVGYNILIDRYGTVYEGRAGGLKRGVIGAHARGYNRGSFGVTVMGNFVSVDAPQAAYDSLAHVIAWKASLHGFNPRGTTGRTYNGNRLRAVSGHRDMGQTACPGRIQNRMGWLRDRAAALRADTPVRTEPAPEPPPSPFPDVPRSSLHRKAILRLDEAHIMRGLPDGRFGPERSLSRGQLATILGRALDIEPQRSGNDFKDVPRDHPHAGYIRALTDEGLVHGFNKHHFGPERPVRRDQLATFVARALELRDRPHAFPDVHHRSPHAGAIGATSRAKIVNGFGDGTFRPDLDVRRDQAASIVSRAFL